MIILCYDSKTHEVEVDRDGVKSTVTIDEARKLFESNQVDDHTLSWSRLVQLDYDPAAVEQFYKDADEQRTRVAEPVKQHDEGAGQGGDSYIDTMYGDSPDH